MAIQLLGTVPYSAAGFGDALTHGLAGGVAAAEAFFPAKNWEAVAREADRHSFPREQLHTILHNRATEYGASPAALANIDRLRKPGTHAVATGQQAGLFGGPLYSLHKALTAIKLARKFGAVPVFWVAGDDHDLAEIDHADLLDKNGSLHRLYAPLNPRSAGRSACDVIIDPAALETMRTEMRGIVDGDTIVQRLIDVYSGRSLSGAFAKLLNDHLGPLGLVVVEAHDLRALGTQVLLKELSDFEETAKSIGEAGAAMEARGYKPGFSGKQRPGPHFFITTEPAKIRARLEPSGAGTFHEHSPAFEQRDENARSYSAEELKQLIREHPQRFSMAAALRPVLQQSVFPVVAAVLGPGEIEYWAQLKKVHDHFGAVFPLVVPRASLTLIDSHAEKTMRKLNIEPNSPELLGGEEALKQKLLSGDETAKKIQERTAAILAELDKLAADVQSVDKGLNPLFEKTRERFVHELQRIAEKTAASLGQREGANLARLRQLCNLVRPKNQPQERVLNCGQFLAQYPNLASELLEAIDPEAREHLLFELI